MPLGAADPNPAGKAVLHPPFPTVNPCHKVYMDHFIQTLSAVWPALEEETKSAFEQPGFLQPSAEVMGSSAAK